MAQDSSEEPGEEIHVWRQRGVIEVHHADGATSKFTIPALQQSQFDETLPKLIEELNANGSATVIIHDEED